MKQHHTGRWVMAGLFAAVELLANAGEAGVTVVDCPRCDRLARYSDDGKSATVNRARFSGEGAEAAITAAVRRAEAVLAANIVPDEAVRPLMGWSSWNCFALEINEEKIVSQAVAMATNGLKAAGFLYINTDDGFFDGHDGKGNLKWNLKRFPKGMKPVVDGIHAQGLKAGKIGVANAYCHYGTKTVEACRLSLFVFDTEANKVHELRLSGGNKKYNRPNRPQELAHEIDIG